MQNKHEIARGLHTFPFAQTDIYFVAYFMGKRVQEVRKHLIFYSNLQGIIANGGGGTDRVSSKCYLINDLIGRSVYVKIPQKTKCVTCRLTSNTVKDKQSKFLAEGNCLQGLYLALSAEPSLLPKKFPASKNIFNSILEIFPLPHYHFSPHSMPQDTDLYGLHQRIPLAFDSLVA